LHFWTKIVGQEIDFPAFLTAQNLGRGIASATTPTTAKMKNARMKNAGLY